MEKMEQYLNAEIEEIKKHKWILSEIAGKDLGEEAVKDWIRKYAKVFRDEWNKSHGE